MRWRWPCWVRCLRQLPALPSPASGAAPPSTAGTDPAALVHPLDGTATGPVSPGTVGEFPGADLPFGMIQWSPDTSPNAAQSGGGLRLRRLSDQRLQPHPSERHGMPVLSGRPDPAHRGCGDVARDGGRHLLAPAGACRARSLSGRARGPGPHLGLPGRHHAVGHLELRPSRAAPSPTCSSRWPTASTPSRRPACTSSVTTRSRAR